MRVEPRSSRIMSANPIGAFLRIGIGYLLKMDRETDSGGYRDEMDGGCAIIQRFLDMLTVLAGTFTYLKDIALEHL